MSRTYELIIEIIDRRKFLAIDYANGGCCLSAQSENMLVTALVAIKTVWKLIINKAVLTTVR